MLLFRWLRILLPFLLLTGCGFNMTRIEINEQTFVFTLYINQGQEPDTVEVTISAPLPNRLTTGKQAGGEGAGSPYAMVTKTSSTVQDALHLIQRDLSRRFDFSHTKVVVIGKSYAEAGIEDLMDWLQREPTTDLSTFLMVAPGDAKDIASMSPVFEQMPSEVLIRFGSQHNMISTTLKDCLYAASANQGYALTYLSAGVQKMISEKNNLEPWAGVQGTALFQNHKLRATLPMKESLAVSWAENELKGPLYTISWGNNGKASVYIISNKAKKSVRIKGGHPVYTIKLEGVGDVIYKKNRDQSDSLDTRNIIQTKLNEQIQGHMKKALAVSQNNGADILQLGMVLDWNYPDHWENVQADWPSYYKDHVEIDVVTDISIRNFGTTLKMKPE
ncbi:hypothetical protein JCM10914A_07260 [Paenibacillus sp. JCM 10914]|uniref:Ger(x)C family spore germination protein n=1 Tax=Paenibacillus sp. JCM 10914 TaxID=1236974 RepID=UPI0003CC90F8|nr:Ger(x)C family spore germination protein [Paenibacillus sp. JCM 10914]GAE05769.1 spore germination protein GerKC [Paenibacillus sp. JCM 10914]